MIKLQSFRFPSFTSYLQSRLVRAKTEHALLCLRCRGRGHDVDHCTSETWEPELGWAFSQARRTFDLGTVCSSTNQVICPRCEDLDLIQLLESRPPWNSQSELSEAFEKGNESILSLGKTGSIQFWADCPICCCLFAITQNPSSAKQEVLLLPDWTICRVAGEMGIKMDSPEKQYYATCLLSVLKPSSIPLPVPVVAHRGDSLCLVESDIGPQRTLGGREIDSHETKVDMILGWINACVKNHDASCLPVPTTDLEEVRFIDVESRQVVKYPGPDCEYVALSYVWGDVTQGVYKLGDILHALPRTLEDAISFTKKLGKRHIWVDSLCIDQSDAQDKANQIDRMWSIYRGAYITVIALSGTSADAGLSRLSRPEYYPQLTCRIKGKTLISLMPTLSQQIWVSPWGGRAWTFQEGLLAPRCLYISDHQIYFDCSSMQCCESLDETRSWAHGLSPSSNPTEEGFVTWMLRQAGAGALRIPLDWPSRRLEHWGEKLNLYSYRNMKYAEDGIRAFAGVLQRLETIYPKGFFWGLPVEDFDWALLWRSQVPPVRREGFPTWSWAGWKGSLFYGQPMDVKKTRRIPTDLEIRRSKSGHMEQIFATKCYSPASDEIVCIVLRNDPIDRAARLEPPELEFDLEQYPDAEEKGYLFITGIFLEFLPDFGRPRTGTYQAGQYETFSFRIREVQCHIRITSTDRWVPGHWDAESWVLDLQKQDEWIFILIARDYAEGFILHHLMLIGMRNQRSIAERATVLELLVPLDNLEILEEFRPRKRRIVLV
jgi:hypothetical protein